MNQDNEPWKEAQPIKGFEHFIEVFRRIKENGNKEVQDKDRKGTN